MRWRLCGLAVVALLTTGLANQAEDRAEAYRTPYDVRFTVPIKELLGDLEGSERGNPHEESSVPYRDWYGRRVRERWDVWGPPARHFAAPREVLERPIEWRRERVIAVARRFAGYGYQHHHIPDWDPPRDWPWKETAVGHNGKGVDCSNFTSFVYNLGFGLKPISAIKEQAETLEIPGPGEGRTQRAERVDLPKSYEERLTVLRTGDLIYIRNKREELAHVVIWVGSIGQAPDNTPLVIDSHGEDVKDSRGETIPVGIRLRPFRENSWYNKSASHAHRILHGR